MHKIFVIGLREYKALVQTKAFLVSLVMLPIFMFGGIFAQKYLSDRMDVSDKTVVVLDGTGRMFAPMEALAQLHNDASAADTSSGRRTRSAIKIERGPDGPVADDERMALSDRVRHNEIFTFVEIDADALSRPSDSPLVKMLKAQMTKSAIAGAKAEKEKDSNPEAGAAGEAKADQGAPDQHEAKPKGAPVRIHMESIADDHIGGWLTQTINQVAFALRLQDAGLNPTVVASAAAPVDIEQLGLYSRSGGELHKADASSRGLAFFIPFGLVMLMFMSMMLVCQPMISSVLEEKQQRIAEVLLGSASPFQLMMGKLMGNVGAAITIVAFYLTGGYFVAAHFGYADMVPLAVMGWFVAFEIIACIMFGSIFIGIGAACNDLKDAQSLLTPVMLLLIFPLMVWFTVLQEPLSSFATWMSLFPPATPMLMLLRLAATPMVPLWQPILGMLLVLATTVVVAFAAGRVFRIGILMQGKSPKVTELARWIVRG